MNNFSYGFELELSDIDRSIDIPVHLGHWEGDKVGLYNQSAELDIVNTLPPFVGFSPDPLNEWCTVGGEINVAPTFSIKTQLAKVKDIFDLFPVVKSGHVNHFHIHVHIPGIKQDFNKLKQFTNYVLDNQEFFIESTYLQNFHVSENISEYGRMYLKSDGGRYVNPIIRDRLDDCNTVEDILNLFKLPSIYYDRGQMIQHHSIRTGINMSQLIKGETIEFRCFRSTIDFTEIMSELKIVEKFCESAMTDCTPINEILSKDVYRFAPLTYVHSHQIGWEKTKPSKDRGGHIKYSKTQFVEPNDITLTDSNEFWNQVESELLNG